MKSKAELFFENLKGKKVAFIGAGVSHKKLIEIFSQEGAVVTLCDKKTLEGFGEYGQTLKELGVNLSLGENYLDGLKGQDMIMKDDRVIIVTANTGYKDIGDILEQR